MGIIRKVTSFFRLVGIGFSLPIYYVRFHIARRRAIGAFKRELIASGVSPMEADELACLYPFKFNEIMDMTRNFKAS